MKSGKPIDISKASLVSLKAELVRKKEEAEKLKGSENYVKLPPKPKPEIKANPGVSGRNEKDLVELSSEEVDLLQKSKDVLKIKSNLYDQLQSGSLVSDDGKSRYLVDFERKEKVVHDYSDEIGPPPPPVTADPIPEDDPGKQESDGESEDDSDWVEYKDCLGRSRRCLKSDLPAMKERDETLAKAVLKELPRKTESDQPPKDEIQELRELVSSDMHLEELRKKWEQKEMELLSKQDIHYEDVLFDEARSHGVGYWRFSTDGTKRHEEQEMLRKIRQDTEQKQKEAKALRDRREQQRQARLIAARQRQRARLGLPPIDPSELLESAKKEDEAEPENEEGEEIKEDLELKLRKAAHVRPWDVGKDGVQQPVMTQEEWVEKKREERIDEFAPTYQQAAEGPSVEAASTKKKKKKKQQQNIQPNIETDPSTSYPDFETDFPVEETNPMFSRTKNFLKKRKAQDEAGSSAYSPGHWSSSDDDVPPEPRKPKGAEVPPPMDFEYFTAAKTRPKSSSASTIQQTADAIEAGLQLLRQQVESSKHDDPKNTRMDP